MLIFLVVPSVTGTTSALPEEKVLEKSFDILFAFDEVSLLLFLFYNFFLKILYEYFKVITFGGYRESITLQQIRTNMEMESHEEKLHNMIKTSKMESAKDQARDAAKVIREKQREMQKLGQSPMAGIGSHSNSESSSSSSSGPYSEPAVIVPSPAQVVSSSRTQQAPVKGMSLTGGAKNKSLEDALVKEDKLAPIIKTTAKSAAASNESAAAAYVAPVVQHPVMMVIAEKVTAKLTRDGMIEAFEIKGSLTLTAATDAAALCSVQLKPSDSNNSGFRFNTHPNVNKALYEKSNTLQLKDASKGFPSSRPVGILKWTYSSTTSDEMVPIKINCWPEEEARGQMNVNIEYNMDVKGIELHDVRIRIPLGTSDAPNILTIDGSHKHNASAGELLWDIDLIDQSNTTGSLEFSIQQRNADAFFPISVQFSSKQLYCSVDVAAVKALNGGAPILYGLTKGMSSEEYTIG